MSGKFSIPSTGIIADHDHVHSGATTRICSANPLGERLPQPCLFPYELKHTSTSYQLFDLSGFNCVKLSVGGDASASRSCPGMTPTVLRSDMESLLTTDFRRVDVVRRIKSCVATIDRMPREWDRARMPKKQVV